MADFLSALHRAILRYGVWALVLAVAIFIVVWALDQWAGDWAAKMLNSAFQTMWGWTLQSPVSAAIVYCAAFMVFCSIIATRDELLRKYVELVREPDTPALDLIWKPGERTYHYAYRVKDNPTVNIQYRICVVNVSKRTEVKAIKVRLEALDPHELTSVPCHFRLMNNLLPHQEPIEEFSLNIGERRFVDVMVQAPGWDKFWMLTTTTLVEETVPAQPYRFTVSVTSSNTPAITKNFAISKDTTYWAMKEVNV